ncbi:unnamed protein product [Owenia fusiformis]|uniref:Uncharacterized protein n=1 Tax=Owenia fusiformis TaxID=6347 RepID=A0A8S4PVN9_OWEFU|nr:unnamed protein product [Owenia fusiformis]
MATSGNGAIKTGQTDAGEETVYVNVNNRKRAAVRALDNKQNRMVIPAMPMPMAIACCVCNFIIPGLGTWISAFALFCHCSDTTGMDEFEKAVACLTGVGVACAQLVLTPLALFGYIWSCAWGVLFITTSRNEQTNLAALRKPRNKNAPCQQYQGALLESSLSGTWPTGTFRTELAKFNEESNKNKTEAEIESDDDAEHGPIPADIDSENEMKDMSGKNPDLKVSFNPSPEKVIIQDEAIVHENDAEKTLEKQNNDGQSADIKATEIPNLLLKFKDTPEKDTAGLVDNEQQSPTEELQFHS